MIAKTGDGNRAGARGQVEAPAGGMRRSTGRGGAPPYTLLVAGLSDHCGICGMEFLFALPRCPICHKSVCDGCAKRMGGSTFCGTECSHAFFFGGDEEIVGSRGRPRTKMENELA